MRPRVLARWSAMLFLLAVVTVTGCENDPEGPLGAAGTVTSAEPTMLRADVETALEVSLADRVTLLDFDRETITGDVAHYVLRVQVGPGVHDVIGVHRVVRETAPYQPIRTFENVMLYHGDLKDFVGCFLPGALSPTFADDFGMAYFLADRGVDVWGIDAGWALVEAGAGDLSFMADWGLDRLTDDLATAVDVARAVRAQTGSGFNKMLLAGFSGGGPVVVELADRETSLPYGQRSVGGIVPMDQAALSDDPAWQEASCGEYTTYTGMLAAGEFALENPFPFFGSFATDDPDGDSPLIPGFTNYQAALALGAYPFLAQVPSVFVAGEFDATGIPTGLVYSDEGLWIDFLRDAPPYFPAAAWADVYQEMCPTAPSGPWFEHLDRIEVPTLYVTANGGFGRFMDLTVERMTRSEVRRLDVSVTGDPTSDFSHVDLVLGENASSLVWEPVREWIVEHSRPGQRGQRNSEVDAR